jgi:succinate dehydrogenase / fumarate reductase flavoprotein subunit
MKHMINIEDIKVFEGTLNSAVPAGPIQEKWSTHKFNMKLVNPSNRRKHNIIVVGSGLAGGSAAASLGEMGYNVHCFFYQDSARRAHSVAAQGGINAAKNYRNDGDSIFRLFYDTVKGGDYRSREANVYRLAEVSNNIIDQCVAQGVPFAREYGGMLDNRSFGGAQVSRTFYARGQTGQQLLLGAYQALQRQAHEGAVKLYPRTEMLDLILVDGRARGIVTRDMVTGEIKSHLADAVVLATGGYSNAYFLSTNAKGCNTTAIWRAHKRGALFANPCFVQIHPTCIPATGEHQSKLTLMSESLRNDGRIWVPRQAGDNRPAARIPESERFYYLEEKYPSFGNLVPRDVASRNAKSVVDEGHGVGELKNGVYLDFSESIGRLGKNVIQDRYGNLFDMYTSITGEDPYETPMRIYPAIHYTMGGLQPAKQHPRPVCHRRSQLLRPRGQPPGGQRFNARAGRWLLCAAVHPGQLHCPNQTERRRPQRRRSGRSGKLRHRQNRAAALHQRHQNGHALPSRVGPGVVGLCGHGPQ